MPEPETNNPVTASPAPDVPAGTADSAAPPTDAGMAAQLEAAKAEAAAHYDRFMRAAADLENFRRRVTREKEEWQMSAIGRVLEDIFPVLDNLALAITAAKQPGADVKSLVGGVEIVLNQLKSALVAHGLREINPVGESFDPHQHDAISHLPSAEVPEEHVLNVVRIGYAMNGRLLRPASVVVSSGPAGEGSG